MTDHGGLTEAKLLAWIEDDQDGEAACRTLPESVHTFWLHFRLGISYQMLGRRLGIAQSTITRRCQLVRARLRHPDRRLDEVLDGTALYDPVFGDMTHDDDPHRGARSPR